MKGYFERARRDVAIRAFERDYLELLTVHHRPTTEHQQRVARIIEHLDLPLNARQHEELREAATWHDVGKLWISPSILEKRGTLTRGEYHQMRQHATRGASCIDNPHIKRIVIEHHEHWNGHGYPHRLAFEQICLPARILSIVDAFDALTSEREYHHKISPADCIDVLSSASGTQFDPRVFEQVSTQLERYQPDANVYEPTHPSG